MKYFWTWMFVCSIALCGCGKETKGAASADAPHEHIPPPPLEKSLSRAKELGLATTAAELAAARPVRADQAGKVYASIKDIEKNESAHLLERFLRDQASASEADKAVSDLSAEFATLERAVAVDVFAPDRDWSLGMEMDYTEYEPMQRGAIAFLARAVRKAEKGDIAGSEADFKKAAKVAYHASQEDLVMSEFLTTVIIDHWWRAAVKASAAKPDFKAALAAVSMTLPAVEAKKGVGTDLAIILTTIQRIRDKKVTYSKVAGFDEPVIIDGKNMDDILAKRLDEAEAIAAAYAVKAYDNWDDRKKMLQMIHDAEHMAQNEGPEDTAIHAFEALAMSFSLPLKNGEALSQAELECFRIAAAAADMKTATGAWPDLDAAAKQAGTGTTDPFSGNKYQFKPDGDKVTVYSVGLDGNDDKGKPYKPGEMKGTDIVVTF